MTHLEPPRCDATPEELLKHAGATIAALRGQLAERDREIAALRCELAKAVAK